MMAHRYRVGMLSEMPPQGKVGISSVCLLGVNILAGREISLRLRTDDLQVGYVKNVLGPLCAFPLEI